MQPRVAKAVLYLGLALAATVAGGCAHFTKPALIDQGAVSGEVTTRFGYSLGPPTCPREAVYPNGITLHDELTEEAAVLVALWNNALFHETLCDLGMAHGDLVQAGLLPNPELIYLFPASDKPFRYAVDLPIEAIWLRPIRVKAAEREYERTCKRLTQAALDLIRDTRQAYADALIAAGRLQVAEDAVRIRQRIAELAQARLDAGDISPQEASTALIDASRARQDAVRQGFEIGIAQERLRNLMGVGDDRTPLRLRLESPRFPPAANAEALTAEATNLRPDAQAAAVGAAAAAERLRLSKLGWIRFFGILDATSGTRTGHEFSPAFRVTLPILNWNQGAIARAEAELEKAERQRQTVHNQVVLDVQTAHLRYSQGRAELAVLNEFVRPEVEAAIRRTEKAYREGHTPYVVVLQTTQQLIDSRFREVQLQGDLRRSWADLERSVGRHLDDLPTPQPEPLPPP